MSDSEIKERSEDQTEAKRSPASWLSEVLPPPAVAAVSGLPLEQVTMDTLDETDFDPDLEDKPGSSGNRDIHTVRANEGSSSVHEFAEATNEWGTTASGSWGTGTQDPKDMGQVTMLNQTNPDDDDEVIRREIGGGGEAEGEFPSVGVIGEDAITPPPHLTPTSHPDYPHESLDHDHDALGDLGDGSNQPSVAMAHNKPRPLNSRRDEDDDEDDEDDDDDVHAQPPEGAYDPADFEHLNVSPDIQELFSYITRYTPQAIELEHRLRPYIPDYIPAVGDIDAFIKIGRPDGKKSLVGLTVLDEPSAKQSDATVLDLQLRALAKHSTAKSMAVKTIENAEKNSKVIDKWVRDISDLHRAKPPPTVHYTKRMPDIDSLMQEWPGEVEELLKEVNLPSAALEVDLPQYVDIICGILDIPVYKSRIQSLHVLFTLYSVFKNSAHFRQLAEENYMDNNEAPEGEHLVL